MYTVNLNNHNEISNAKRMLFQVMSGGSAGLIEVCLMQPLDVVKTRLQIQNKSAVAADVKQTYNGVFDCIVKMYRQEGFTSLWKGIVPPILAETPKRAIKFMAFEQMKPFYMFGRDSPTPLTFALAGLSSGLMEGTAVNFLEVIKVAQQANHGKERISTWVVARDIVRRDGFGLNGLNKGVTAMMGRSGMFNLTYFGFYHSAKKYVPTPETSTGEFLQKIVLGFMAGTLACCSNIPFDVVKSRIQGPQPVPGEVKYSRTFKSMVTIYKEEGFFALYRGLLPKIMRLGPGGAIMLLTFDYVYDYLLTEFS